MPWFGSQLAVVSTAGSALAMPVPMTRTSRTQKDTHMAGFCWHIFLIKEMLIVHDG